MPAPAREAEKAKKCMAWSSNQPELCASGIQKHTKCPGKSVLWISRVDEVDGHRDLRMRRLTMLPERETDAAPIEGEVLNTSFCVGLKGSAKVMQWTPESLAMAQFAMRLGRRR